MTEIDDLNDAIAHVREYTGEGDAWRAGLAPTDLAVLLPAAVIDTRELTRLLQKVRANHPQLFDPRSGAPVTPPAARSRRRPHLRRPHQLPKGSKARPLRPSKRLKAIWHNRIRRPRSWICR